jgi:Putative adhesin
VTSPQDATTRQFEVAGPLEVRVHLDYGSVRVVARSETTATVLAAPAIASRQHDVEAAQNVRVTSTGDVLEVRGTASGWRRLVRPGAADVEIGVPAGSRITVTTAYAEVELVGAFGDCSVQSTGGDVRVEEVARGHVQSRYGNVTVDRLADGGRVESTHGTVRVRAAGGTTTLAASSGDVVVDRASGELTVRNTYGTVEIGAMSSGSCAVTTSYGSVGIGIPAGTAAYLDLQSDHGRVRSELGRSDEPGAGVERASIRARTSYGAITIRRA